MERMPCAGGTLGASGRFFQRTCFCWEKWEVAGSCCDSLLTSQLQIWQAQVWILIYFLPPSDPRKWSQGLDVKTPCFPSDLTGFWNASNDVLSALRMQPGPGQPRCFSLSWRRHSVCTLPQLTRGTRASVPTVSCKEAAGLVKKEEAHNNCVNAWNRVLSDIKNPLLSDFFLKKLASPCIK